MKVLVTGFDPFGGEKVNPAWEAVQRLDSTIAGAQITKAQVPTVFRRSIDSLVAAIEREAPDLVICVGQAGGRYEVTVERVAINISDAVIADNEGNQPIDEPIVPDGPAAYFARLPIKAMVEKIRNAQLPASVSNTAGTFVCNHIMYGLLHYIHTKRPQMRGGFIHVPYIPEQVVHKKQMPSMSLDDIVKSLTLAIKAAVEHKEDIKSVGGKIV